jgi:hypothetical protein|tara:strand:- start:254 stop:412 length:159 start_codon:yes stop_codon:yes gene_type:complete
MVDIKKELKPTYSAVMDNIKKQAELLKENQRILNERKKRIQSVDAQVKGVKW